MSEVTQLDITGHDAIDSAAQMLKALGSDSGKKRVEITITDLDTDKSPAVEDSGENEQVSESGRSRGDIRENTSHHYALYSLAQLSKEGDQVTGNHIIEEVDEYGSTSVRPALTHLYKRELVDRKKVGGSNPFFVYKITDWGKEVLDELGTPE